MSRIKRKAQLKLRKIRQPRTEIVSFRLRKVEAALLKKDLKENPIAGVKSLEQFSRKLIVDYARGRTVYIDPIDRQIEPDAREKLNRPLPDPNIQNHEFVNILLGYLQTEDQWNRLRFLMLQAGWPKNAIESYRKANNSMERMFVVSEVLREMLK